MAQALQGGDFLQDADVTTVVREERRRRDHQDA
jgi:hypothetical protein